MKFKKNQVIINNREFFYWEKGGKQNPSMVLLHGFPGSHTGLVDLAKGLSDDYWIIIPDLPSCGISANLSGVHNLKNYSDWLDGFLQTIGVENTILVGHSFGARLALVFASNYPEKVEKLVLITPVPKVAGLIARLVLVEYKIAEILPMPLKKIWLLHDGHRQIGNAIIFKSSSPARRQKLMARDSKELRHLNPKINIELFQEFYKFSLIPVIKRVKAPALVIASDLDEIAPVASVKELTMQMEHATFTIMKNSGHLVPLERPRATANIIKKFLHS